MNEDLFLKTAVWSIVLLERNEALTQGQGFIYDGFKDYLLQCCTNFKGDLSRKLVNNPK